MSEHKISELKLGLKFASQKRKLEIQSMIDELSKPAPEPTTTPTQPVRTRFETRFKTKPQPIVKSNVTGVVLAAYDKARAKNLKPVTCYRTAIKAWQTLHDPSVTYEFAAKEAVEIILNHRVKSSLKGFEV